MANRKSVVNTDASKKKRSKVGIVLKEFSEGKLKMGKSNKKVTSKPQAIAIGLSEARKHGEKVSPLKKSKKKPKA